MILGFNTSAEIFYEQEFRALGVPVHITTVDGSCGVQGFVTDVMKDLSYTYFYTCGPRAHVPGRGEDRHHLGPVQL